MQQRFDSETEMTFEDRMNEALHLIKGFIIRLNPSSENKIELVPSELMIKIISELDLTKPENLTNLMLVSKPFLELVKKNIFWQHTAFNTHEQYLAANQFNQLVVNKGIDIALGQRIINQVSTQETPQLKILLLGDGEKGAELELAAFHKDEMGYGGYGGAHIPVSNNSRIHSVRLASILSLENLHNRALSSLRYQYENGINNYSREFIKNGKQGGAEVAIIAVNIYNWERSLAMCAEDSSLEGKLIFLMVDSYPGHKEVLYKDSQYAKFLATKYPQVHERIAGMLEVKGSKHICDTVVSQIVSVIEALEFAAGTAPYLGNLSNDLKKNIVSHLGGQDAQTMLLVSQGFFRTSKNLPSPSAAKAEGTCSIM